MIRLILWLAAESELGAIAQQFAQPFLLLVPVTRQHGQTDIRRQAPDPLPDPLPVMIGKAETSLQASVESDIYPGAAGLAARTLPGHIWLRSHAQHPTVHPGGDALPGDFVISKHPAAFDRAG